MKKLKKVTQAMQTIASFIDKYDLSSESVDAMLSHLKAHKMEPTERNLFLAFKAIYQQWIQEHPQEYAEWKAAHPAPKFTWEQVARMSSEEFKQKILTDSDFREFVNGPEPKPVSPEPAPEPRKVMHDFGADLPDADRAELQKMVEQKRKERA
jgi:hypothetical protein